METVRVRIKGGKVEITTEGFAGAACQKATETLERRLGKKASDTPTDEMYVAVEPDLQTGS